AKRKAIKTKNPQDCGNYRKLRNRINNKVKTTKASYYHNSFIQSKGNSQRTWKTINNRIFPTPFNEHFSTIGPRLARDISSTSDEESIYLENIT
ncbi:unnamed protein product, partial [Pocillopora meandrina]